MDSTQFRQGVGALEAYSFATYPAGGVPFFDTHEPAHTWWGGIINNDYLASIWNEGFADYSMVLFKRDQPIGDMPERQRAYAAQVAYAPQFRRSADGALWARHWTAGDRAGICEGRVRAWGARGRDRNGQFPSRASRVGP